MDLQGDKVTFREIKCSLEGNNFCRREGIKYTLRGIKSNSAISKFLKNFVFAKIFNFAKVKLRCFDLFLQKSAGKCLKKAQKSKILALFERLVQNEEKWAKKKK